MTGAAPGTDAVAAETLPLAGEFPAATDEQWRALVTGVLSRGKPGLADDPDALATAFRRTLVTTTADGIEIAPLYTRGDDDSPDADSGLPGLSPFVRGATATGAVVDGWDVRARHGGPDPAVVNEEILADLAGGVTSLWLRLGPDGSRLADLPRLLDGVLLDLAGVVLDAGEDFPAAAAALREHWERRGVTPDVVTGSYGADPIGVLARTGDADLDRLLPAAAALAVQAVADGGGVRAIVADGLPYHEAGGSDAEELAAAVATGVAYLRALTDAGLSVDEAFGQVEFRLATSADQFLGIAKLRAHRRLWARVADVSGATAAAGAARQHAVTSSVMLSRRDPWVNLLRTTVACFAAGVGGAAAVTVAPFDSALGRPDALGRRIARNTSALLLDESGVGRVVDPAGGSPYVESLTDALAERAWQFFTEIERHGGIVAALRSGLVADRLAATWAARTADVARRRIPLTGVSEFPDIGETLLPREPVAATVRGGLPQVRLADGFEALRDAADATAQRGARPAIFLANLGPVSAFTARATFAKNLFEAGGIHADAGTGGDAAAVVAQALADGPPALVCLCSSDAGYAEAAATVARELKAAGVGRVYLAGRPADADALREAGVDEFVYAGCDALDVLARALDSWGAHR
ncbi:MAG: methylmalonyl-CoA mutase [Actinomycetota bacterium]|nr:MAG: methylmalonyl-CoA mutase [Actinomycetota bacterium]